LTQDWYKEVAERNKRKRDLSISTLYLSEVNITNRALIVKSNTLMSISKAQCSKYATAISIERLVFLARKMSLALSFQ
jgi:hypothetical protein